MPVNVNVGLGTFALDVDEHDLAGAQLTEEHLLGHGVLDLALHGAAQRTSAQHRVEASRGEQVLGRGRELEAHVLVLEPDLEALDHHVDQLDDLVLGERREHHDLVDAVEELRPEVLLELFGDLGLHLVVGARRRRRTG